MLTGEQLGQLRHLKSIGKGVNMAKTETAQKTFSDEFGKGSFYPDIPKRPLAEVLDKTFSLVDATIIEGFESKFGTSDFSLLLLEDVSTGEQFTTLCGGMVVVKKVRQALDKKLLPLFATIVKPAQYYDIL